MTSNDGLGSDDPEKLCTLVRRARVSRGLTQEGLAERLLIGQSAVSKVERGVQRLDLVELQRWLSAIGSPSLTSFVDRKSVV